MEIVTKCHWLELYNKLLWRHRQFEHLAHMQKVRCLTPSHNRCKFLKQVVSAPLPNAHQQVSVSQVHGDDHQNGCSPCHSRCGMLNGPHCSMVSGDLYKWVKNSRMEQKTDKIKSVDMHDVYIPWACRDFLTSVIYLKKYTKKIIKILFLNHHPSLCSDIKTKKGPHSVKEQQLYQVRWLRSRWCHNHLTLTFALVTWNHLLS